MHSLHTALWSDLVKKSGPADEARDSRGRWTSGGDSPAAAGKKLAAALKKIPSFSKELKDFIAPKGATKAVQKQRQDEFLDYLTGGKPADWIPAEGYAKPGYDPKSKEVYFARNQISQVMKDLQPESGALRSALAKKLFGRGASKESKHMSQSVQYNHKVYRDFALGRLKSGPEDEPRDDHGRWISAEQDNKPLKLFLPRGQKKPKEEEDYDKEEDPKNVIKKMSKPSAEVRAFLSPRGMSAAAKKQRQEELLNYLTDLTTEAEDSPAWMKSAPAPVRKLLDEYKGTMDGFINDAGDDLNMTQVRQILGRKLFGRAPK